MKSYIRNARARQWRAYFLSLVMMLTLFRPLPVFACDTDQDPDQGDDNTTEDVTTGDDDTTEDDDTTTEEDTTEETEETTEETTEEISSTEDWPGYTTEDTTEETTIEEMSTTVENSTQETSEATQETSQATQETSEATQATSQATQETSQATQETSQTTQETTQSTQQTSQTTQVVTLEPIEVTADHTTQFTTEATTEETTTWEVPPVTAPPVTTQITTTCDPLVNCNCPTNPLNAGTPNQVSVFDGNAKRRMKELQVIGARGRLGLKFERYHNTHSRSSVAPFGGYGNWRHSWMYNLTDEKVAGKTLTDLAFVYPTGDEVVMHASNGTYWQAEPGRPERAYAISGGIRVDLAGGVSAFFVKVKTSATTSLYEAKTVTDGAGFTTKLAYDGLGNLIKVTEPGGRFLKFTYQSIGYQRTPFDAVLAQVGAAPVTGQWVEYPVAAAAAASKFQYLRVRGTKSAAIAVAEVQFLTADGRVLAGKVYGTGLKPESAFDGNSATVFTGDVAGNFVGLDLGLAAPSAVSKIRILSAQGHEAALAGAMIEGVTLTKANRPLLTEVRTSDNQSVKYQYSLFTLPYISAQIPLLSSTDYKDGTQAHYKYGVGPTVGSRPQLIEADDPRFVGRASHVRYSYHDEKGTVHQEINPVTGGVYASLEFDATDSGKRVVHYGDLKQETFRFDKGGRLVEKVDSLGRSTKWEYKNPGKGPATARIDYKGSRTEWQQDAHGRVIAMLLDGQVLQRAVEDAKSGALTKTDRYGRSTTTSFVKTAQGQKKVVQHFDGTTDEILYDSHGREAEEHLRDGRIRKFSYDQAGRRTGVTDSAGNRWTYVFDLSGRQVSVTDPLGHVTRHEYDARGLVTKTTLSDGLVRKASYDKYGRLASETDEAGRTNLMSYDMLGRVTRKTDHVGRITTFDYTDLPQGCSSCSLVDHPTRVRYFDGRIESMLYDTEGRLLSHTSAVGTSAAATTSYAYDNENNRIAVTNALGLVTRFSFDQDHRLVRRTDASGRQTVYAYTPHGLLASATHSDGTKTVRNYDRNDRCVSVTDRMGRTTQKTLDSGGRVIAITDSTGSTRRPSYDANGRRSAISHSDGTTRSWSRDAAGRVVGQTSPDGLRVNYSLDSRGRLLAYSDSAGRTKKVTYDALGRPLSVTDALGRIAKRTYDARGNVESTTMADGGVVKSAFDSRNRRVSTTDAAGHKTIFAYSDADDLISVTDANGNTYSSTFDALHRRTSLTYPDGTVEKWVFDALSHVISFTSRMGQTKTVSYNIDGLPTKESWSAGSGLADVNFIYDANSRLASLDNGSAKITYSYDNAGRLISETTDVRALLPGLATSTVQYKYDALGRRAELVYPDRTSVTYQYDDRGRVTKLDNDNGRGQALVEYSYDQAGRVASVVRKNGVRTAYTYDSLNGVTDIVHSGHGGSGASLAAAHYAFDVMGRRVSQTREDGLRENYSYDAVGQVSAVDYGTTPVSRESFSYDSTGNRAQATATTGSAAPVATSYTANRLNQYTQRNVAPAATVMTWDANGNMTSSGSSRYWYDAKNRLIAVEGVGSSATPVRVEMYYDGRNRCVVRKLFNKDAQGRWALDGKGSLAFTYDRDWNILTERTLDGDQAGSYVHGSQADEIICAHLGRSDFYALADGLHNTVAVSDSSGNTVERFRYDVSGHPKFLTAGYVPSTQSASGYHFLFTGRDWIAAAGLTDHRNRFYSPDLGRWLSADPIGFAGGDVNIYRYAMGDPVNQTDPLGLACPCQSGSWSGNVWMNYIVGGFGGGDFTGTVTCSTDPTKSSLVFGFIVAGGVYAGASTEMRTATFTGAAEKTNLLHKQYQWLMATIGVFSTGTGNTSITLGVGFGLFGAEITSAQ